MTAPEVDDRAVDLIVRSHLPREPHRRLVLVYGRYAPAARARFTVQVGDTRRDVMVQDHQSVLGILGAWHAHRDAGGDSVLVVITAVGDAELGWDVRGHALRRSTLTVDRAEIVAQRFGAVEIEPGLRGEPWLLDALLDAEPHEGWRRSGPVLTRSDATAALLAARFGLTGDVPDAGTLLEWSQAGGGPARFAELSAAEQDGIAAWLAETVGPFAVVFVALVRQGNAADVMALGLVMSVLDHAVVSPDAVLAVGGLLGDARAEATDRRAFVAAVEGTLERWVAAAEAGSDRARDQVLAVLNRADDLVSRAGLGAELDGSAYLPSGFRARARAVATTLTTEPDAMSVDMARTALDRLGRHVLARLHPDRCATAAMAVRLVSRLATDPSPPVSVGAWVVEYLRDGGWVDRAMTAVWAGESDPDPVVGHAYGTVHEAARRRRDADDERFARRLQVWAEQAAAPAPGGALLVERVLDDVVAPLVALRSPLVVVVDGMSAAVAVEVGEQVARRNWTEISPDSGRRVAAVATIPSVTRASRTSLLTGRTAVGDQADERAGFTALWKRHGRSAVLLHKAGIAGTAGRRFSEPLVEALAGDGVVGVVLNTVDDALDHGREGDRTAWRLGDITYLPELLDAARSYGRPVVLVSDHGHVLDRGTAGGPAAADGVASARWRTGEAGDGEIALSGPRVLEGGGRLVAAWREDVHYTHRHSGYHGGASPAEMTVPVLVFLPSPDELPMGWSVLTPEDTEPRWWNGRDAVARPAPSPTRKRARKPAPRDDAQGLLDLPDTTPEPPAPVGSLGQRVVASAVFTQQRQFIRRAPEPTAVASLVDALVAARGELSATAAVAAAGRAGRPPGPVLAQLQRLLNVEGYPVLSSDEHTVRLDADMLCLQFGVTGP